MGRRRSLQRRHGKHVASVPPGQLGISASWVESKITPVVTGAGASQRAYRNKQTGAKPQSSQQAASGAEPQITAKLTVHVDSQPSMREAGAIYNSVRDRQPEDAVGSAPNCRFYEKIRTAAQTLSNVGQSCGTPPSPHAAIDREFRLDTILLALWHGRLTAEAAAERIIAELGLGRQAARDEVDGFLRD
jgi:hypothetical protein